MTVFDRLNYVLFFGAVVLVFVLAVWADGCNEAGAEQLHESLIPPVPAEYLEAGMVSGNECGPYTHVCWWALSAAGVGPLASDPGTGLPWLQALGRTLRCESRFMASISGEIDSRDRGIAQINSWHWPEITDRMAFDPVWSIYWMAKKFATGQAGLWHCYTRKVQR